MALREWERAVFKICSCERWEEQSDWDVLPGWVGYVSRGAVEVWLCSGVVRVGLPKAMLKASPQSATMILFRPSQTHQHDDF